MIFPFLKMKSEPKDPFKKDREESGIKNTIFNREEIPFVLRLKDLRKTVKDWQSFSSDHPFKVVPHTEEKMRSMRQIPIEMDPPDHTEYRALVEPFFKRPNNLEYISDMEGLISSMVAEVLSADQVDAVHEFALPLQCRALTRLLKMKFDKKLSYREISEKTRLTEGNVGYKLHHLIQDLASELKAEGITS